MNLYDEDLSQEKGQVIFTTAHGDDIIGVCMIKLLDGSSLKLRQMGVHPDYQGRGVGTQLVKTCE